MEDWGEEIFAEGVGFKWRKWIREEGEGLTSTQARENQQQKPFPHDDARVRT